MKFTRKDSEDLNLSPNPPIFEDFSKLSSSIEKTTKNYTNNFLARYATYTVSVLDEHEDKCEYDFTSVDFEAFEEDENAEF